MSDQANLPVPQPVKPTEPAIQETAASDTPAGVQQPVVPAVVEATPPTLPAHETVANPPVAEITQVLPDQSPTVTTTSTPPAAVPTDPPQPLMEASTTELAVEMPQFSEEYFFSDTNSDRDRLIAQAFLLSEYTRQNATRLVRNDVRTILDMGCGEGQLTLVLSKVYPKAKIVGMDRDAKAIEMARQNQRETPLLSGNVEFILGDIEENLPDGPFDLIFTSLVMVHQAHPEKILRAAYQRLVPNGAIWIKDLHDWTKTFDHPAWDKFYALSAGALRKVNLDPEMGQHLEALMREIGFTNIQTALEPYKANNETWQGRIAMSNMFGVVYNSRQFIARLMSVPEEEILALHKTLRDQAETLKGTWRLINVIGHRPATEPMKVPASATPQSSSVANESATPIPLVPAVSAEAAKVPEAAPTAIVNEIVVPQTDTIQDRPVVAEIASPIPPTPQAEVPPAEITPVSASAAPASTAPTSTVQPEVPTPAITPADVPGEPLPDVSNLYLFDNPDADRDRLVAQTFLFSEFVRENAQRLIRNDVKTILDIGCGHGQLTLVLSKVYPKAQIIGIDIDPNAIEIAKENQRKMPLAPGNVEFIVGDIQDKLPDGPFDLVYASVIMMHMLYPAKVLDLAYQALRPGGSIWIKEAHPDVVLNHPNWVKMVEMVRLTMEQIKRDLFISNRLEEMLTNAGYVNITVKPEVYKANNDQWQGRIAISALLAGVYNARKLVSKMLSVPEEQFLKMHKEVTDSAETLKGHWTLVNFIAQRPKNPAKPSADQEGVESPAQPTSTPPESVVSTPPTPTPPTT